MTAVSGMMNHSVSGGGLVVVDWPIAGHRIWVRVFWCAFENKEYMVPGVFTPDFRAKGFKVFGYSEDSGERE